MTVITIPRRLVAGLLLALGLAGIAAGIAATPQAPSSAQTGTVAP